MSQQDEEKNEETLGGLDKRGCYAVFANGICKEIKRLYVAAGVVGWFGGLIL